MSKAQAAALAEHCPDLAQWPQRWEIDEDDIAVGERIVAFFTPFLLHLLDKGIAPKTFRRHRDHLWLLGGELIGRRYDDDKLKKLPVGRAIDALIEEEGGPLIWPRITEGAQKSFDATCRQLYKYLSPADNATR